MKLSVIKTEEQYKRYCELLWRLMKEQPRNDSGSDDIEHLSLLVEHWDRNHDPVQKSDPIELLKFLMDNHGLNQNDLVKILGIGKSAVSQILNYKKGLSKNVIRTLSEHFKVTQKAFNRPYALIDKTPA